MAVSWKDELRKAQINRSHRRVTLTRTLQVKIMNLLISSAHRYKQMDCTLGEKLRTLTAVFVGAARFPPSPLQSLGES